MGLPRDMPADGTRLVWWESHADSSPSVQRQSFLKTIDGKPTTTDRSCNPRSTSRRIRCRCPRLVPKSFIAHVIVQPRKCRLTMRWFFCARYRQRPFGSMQTFPSNYQNDWTICRMSYLLLHSCNTCEQVWTLISRMNKKTSIFDTLVCLILT
jgi:hypothetical protein